ncbi:MAG: zinc metallopeptidase [Candidatus Poribacteria bacterium]|nr:zinc metallopeptidase [Candidatus Poribacteria bacterium]
MFFFDFDYFLIVGPAFLLAIWAQFKVKSAFNKYSQTGTRSGMTGAQVAQEILRANGIDDVKVEGVRGFLSDHYDPRTKTLRLSPDVFQGRSQASVAVAAHEVGHAIQHAQGYAPLKLRSALVPAVQLGSWVATPVFFLGMMLTPLLFVGVIAFGLIALFQLITLPVEYNASSRALSEIERLGIVGGAEMEGARKTLNAAALTYVAAVAQTLLTILYFLLRLGLLGGDD